MVSSARLVVLSLAFILASRGTAAADLPVAKEADWVARDFRFHTGEVMPELRIHYRTVGDPSGEPVLVLHGTAGSGATMMTPAFAGELFGPGQPLDASRYFIYDDMVMAQWRLLTEGLGIRHLRLVIGNSMGGMQTWLWAQRWPGFMDTAVPMASLPAPMSSSYD